MGVYYHIITIHSLLKRGGDTYHLAGDIRTVVIKLTGTGDGKDQMIVMKNGEVIVMMTGHLVIWIDHVTEMMTDRDTEMMTDHPVT